MENSSAITVLCSTYNSAKWIDGYLESINNQFLEHFDIIFVDANSDDGSLDTIKNFEFREGINVNIIECSEKIPIYEAWNLAIQDCSTPYVINVNTDDRLFPAALITYINYAQAFPPGDVFYASYAQVEDAEHSKVTGTFLVPNPDHNLLLKHCYCGPFPLLKKETIIEDGLFNPDYTISGDYEMWLRMSKKGRNFFPVRESLGSYYYNPEGVSTNRESEHWQEHVRQDIEIRKLYR
jgi:glycosyltransferase involved in cell wall biosynthesis